MQLGKAHMGKETAALAPHPDTCILSEPNLIYGFVGLPALGRARENYNCLRWEVLLCGVSFEVL